MSSFSSSKWKKRVKKWAEVLIVIAISIAVFEFAIQPILASIHPMFTDQFVPLAERSPRVPDTPAEWALLATALVGVFLHVEFKYKISD